MKDLIILVADEDMRQAFLGALSRPEALSIGKITFDVDKHPYHDGGMRTTGPSLLSLQQTRFTHALLVLDFEGSGTDAADGLALEAELNAELYKTWRDAAKSIVIEPELDVWMWGSDNALQEVIGKPKEATIREWLRSCGYSFNEKTDKPDRPKEAMGLLMREIGQRRSSAIYKEIATRISKPRCTDPAFIRLRETLQQWFPVR